MPQINKNKSKRQQHKLSEKYDFTLDFTNSDDIIDLKIHKEPKKTVAKITDASSSPTTNIAVAVKGMKKIDSL